jgi:hypothetical protein
LWHEVSRHKHEFHRLGGESVRGASGTIARVTSPAPDFRCAAASLLDTEPMGGTAPDEGAWLFVEYAGAWGRKAVAESRLPDDVREFLDGLDGIRVQLVRRHGGVSGPGVRVFTARLGAEPGVWSAVLADVAEVPTLDLARPDADPRLTAYDAPLWLVCTNGRRDLCCAETGRPVAAALAARWPDATWETTHLGGHRFAGTLLALPSGYALGRLDPGTAVTACKELEAGRLPLDVVRGRAGLPGAAQVAELHLRRELGLADLDDIAHVLDATVEDVDGHSVTLDAAGTTYVVRVRAADGEPRRQSCGDPKTKAARVYEIESWGKPDA